MHEIAYSQNILLYTYIVYRNFIGITTSLINENNNYLLSTYPIQVCVHITH